MPTYLFAGAGGSLSSNMSTLTYGEALAIIAEPVGAHAVPSKVRAEGAARRAINWLQRELWHYLQVHGTSIVIAASAEEVDLPLPARRIVSVRVGTSTADRELDYIPPNRQRSQLTGGGGIGGTAYYSYAQGTGRTGKVLLVDAWDAVPGVMDIYYLRPILRPVLPGDTLDLVEGPMENAFLDMASHYVAVFGGASETLRTELWQKAHAARREARGMDRSLFGQSLGFIPEYVYRPLGSVLRGMKRSRHAYYEGNF